MTPGDDPPHGSEVILVVDDEDMVRNLVVMQLRSLGYQVLEASDVRRAEQILASAEPIDLLLTDLSMPGDMTGPELAKEAKLRRPGLKALIMSGRDDDALSQSEQNVHFLPKPFIRMDLALKVREALDAA